MLDCEFLIIGSGPAGVNAAWPLAKAGKKVVMIDGATERELPKPPSYSSLEEWFDSSDRWKWILGIAFSVSCNDMCLTTGFLGSIFYFMN